MKDIIFKQKQVLFFMLAGALSAGVELVMMKLFSQLIPYFFSQETNFYGIKYPLSNILSTFCAILANYWLSIKFVFERGKHDRRREFVYFMMVSGVTTFLSLIIFQVSINFIFTDTIVIGEYEISSIILSKIAVIGIVSVINYVVKKKIIFNG